MTPADVLVAAANLIDEVGWWGGEADGDRGSSQCAWTALATVTRGFAPYHEALGALTDHVHNDVGVWNDDSDKTTVIATMRQVAHELRRAEG